MHGLVLFAILSLAQGAHAQLQVTPQSATAPSGLQLIEAIRQSLKQNVNTLLQQQQVVSSQGSVLQQKGPFDPLATAQYVRSRNTTSLRMDELTALQAAGVTNIFTDKVDSVTNVVGISKLLINGTTIGTSYNVTSTNDTLNNLQDIPKQTTGQLSFTIMAPLLKNAGRDTVGAQLEATEAQLLATQLNLLFTNSQTVLTTTVDYWAYLSAQKNLDIALASEKNAQTLVEQLHKLIAADEIPASDIDLAVASLSDKTATRIAAQQAVLDARRVLARQMGISAVQMSSLALPGDEYPDIATGKADLAFDTDRLVKQALDKRADLDADRHLRLAASYLVTAARNNLKPELDLSASGSYAGLAEGSSVSAWGKAYYANRYSPSFNLSLSFQWPVGNSQARGFLLTQLSQEDTAVITIHDLEATIASNVTTQVIGLQRSIAQLAEGIESVRRYTIAVQNELTKRRLGTATLLDVINMQDRLVAAQLNETLQRQTYANAIAQLRYETGTLVRRNGDVFDVRIKDLLYPDFLPEK